MAEPRNWLELPRDVTSTILLQLGAVEILETAQKVCTLWREICKDPAMWRCIDMRNRGDLHAIPYDLEKMAMHAVDRSCGQLVDINIEYFGTNEFLNYVAERSKNLRRLRIVFCCGDITDEGLTVAKKFPFLEELELSYCAVYGDGLKAVGRSCPLLKSLKLNQRLPQRDSDSDYEDWEPDEEALAIAAEMPELRHLQLVGNSLTNTGLQAILDGCPHLESLDLRMCINVIQADDVWNACVARVKYLRQPYDSMDDYEYKDALRDDDGSTSFADDMEWSNYADYDMILDDLSSVHGGWNYDFFGESDSINSSIWGSDHIFD